jgi:hypothetical protein
MAYEIYVCAFLFGGLTLLFAWWKYTVKPEQKAYEKNEKRSSVPSL